MRIDFTITQPDDRVQAKLLATLRSVESTCLVKVKPERDLHIAFGYPPRVDLQLSSHNSMLVGVSRPLLIDILD